MYSKAKKYSCVFLALLVMFSACSDIFISPAEATPAIAAAGVSVVAEVMLVAGILAATVGLTYELAQHYLSQTQTAKPEVYQDIIDISEYIGGGSSSNNNGNKFPQFNIPGGAAGVAFLQKLKNVIDDVKSTFGNENSVADLPPVIDSNYSYYDKIDFMTLDFLKSSTSAEIFEACSYSSDHVTNWYINGVPFFYSLVKNPHRNQLDIYKNNQPICDETCSDYSLSYLPLFSDAYSNPVYRYGFFWDENHKYLFPIIAARATRIDTGAYEYIRTIPEKRTSHGCSPFYVCNITNLSSGHNFIPYSVHNPINTQPVQDFIDKQSGLEKPSINPSTIPFIFPWIIIEPDGNVVENPDISTGDIPLLPDTTTPEDPSSPDEPQPSETPPPSETPVAVPPYFPSWRDYDELRRDYLRRLGLDPDLIISPDTTPLPDDTSGSPNPTSPDPDLPYKPNVDGIPDIGNTWDYVKEFLKDALIWMKLWFSGFVLLPQPVQTSLWALLIIAVVLGLLKVFLQ